MARLDWDLSTFITVSMFLLSLILSGIAVYSTETDTSHQRISVVETQQKNDGQRLDRIEFRLERMDDKLDDIYFGVVGKRPLP